MGGGAGGSQPTPRSALQTSDPVEAGTTTPSRLPGWLPVGPPPRRACPAVPICPELRFVQGTVSTGLPLCLSLWAARFAHPDAYPALRPLELRMQVSRSPISAAGEPALQVSADREVLLRAEELRHGHADPGRPGARGRTPVRGACPARLGRGPPRGQGFHLRFYSRPGEFCPRR